MATKYLCDWCGEDLSYPGSSFLYMETSRLEFNEERAESLTPYRYEDHEYEEYVLCHDCYEELTKPLLTKRLTNKLHKED